MVTSLSILAEQSYDAYVLKAVADGPGMSILEAAEAVGIPTINNSRVLLDWYEIKRSRWLLHVLTASPPTYFVAHPRLLRQIPVEEYPLVVKPSHSSSNQGIYRLNSPADLTALEITEPRESFFTSTIL